MDFIGTVSMTMDISFMLGSNAEEPVYLKGSADNAKGHLIVVRAARAAKLGARAGRLSRVLKVLRFLPFMGQTKASDAPRVAKAISNQLNNALSTRVACLTIFLVVVLPIFGMFAFPEDDHSMRAWAQLLYLTYQRSIGVYEDNMHQDHHSKLLIRELQRFAKFYFGLTYGPFNACEGYYEGEEVFVCRHDFTGWEPTFTAPGRMSSRLVIPTGNFQISFDMSLPLEFEAGMGIVLICFVIIVMCLFGLFLSSSVSRIALVPLERILASVRGVAKQVLKLDADDDDDEREDENALEQSNEFDLLERVVKKLATIAELTSKKNDIEVNEDMHDEDLAMIEMCQTATTTQSKKQSNDASKRRPSKEASALDSSAITELGISAEVIDSWSLDVLEMNATTRVALSGWILLNHPGCKDFVQGTVDLIKLNKFVTTIEKNYDPNPYHNHAHAVDVLHAVSRMLKVSCAALFLTELEEFALLLSALAHDLGHPGFNNPFLVETQHELALRYNDRSPCENMHCAKLFELVSGTDINILHGLEKAQYTNLRKICIEAILHTDMVKHFDMVKDLNVLYQMHASDAGPDCTELFSAAENKSLSMNMFLHWSDVSNPCHPWDICNKWAFCVLNEFFLQGDKEKSLGVPVQMLNDRDAVNKPNSQIGFIEFVVAPLVASSVKLFPVLHELGDNLGENLQKWGEVWEEESKPAAEEAEKVRARVHKVVNNLNEAKSSLTKPKGSERKPSK